MGAHVSNGSPFRLRTEIPHCRSLWIGVLQGTWKEMGAQYGQRCGQDIARSFDLTWQQEVLDDTGSLWQRGREQQDRERYARQYLRRSFAELAHLRPELIELLEGMAEGAAADLDRCAHADACGHFEKVALLNYRGVGHMHPDWDFREDCPGSARPTDDAAGPLPAEDDEDCNGFWVRGAATRTGQTYATRTAQSRHIREGGSGRERQVAYVAIPRDPSARVFWGNGRAGNLGGLGGGLMNDRGVCCLTSGAQFPSNSRAFLDETLAPGIRDFLLATCGVIFGESAEQAAAMATVGTDRYREATGRKTVLRARGCNIVFADANEAFCVEQNARYYAVRRPGNLGEEDGTYLVHANHFKSRGGCFDDSNALRQGRSMSDFAPERGDKPNSTCYRFWSGMWLIRNNYGLIDDSLIRSDLAASHCRYDEHGNPFDAQWGTSPPGQDGDALQGTFCAHMGPYTDEDPLGVGGNAETTVFNLSTREVWWVPVWPCHYKMWDLSWHYTDLKPFAEYRRLRGDC